jgi:hypothetical protein
MYDVALVIKGNVEQAFAELNKRGIDAQLVDSLSPDRQVCRARMESIMPIMNWFCSPRIYDFEPGNLLWYKYE